MKGCELCGLPARMYCGSDQANLCWDCDEKVHAANFLVAKHTRSLLCHVCQIPTPWTASGPKLGRIVSVCESCVDNCNANSGRGIEQEGDSQEEDEDEEYSDSDDEEDGENQVVPWSATPLPPTISPPSSAEVTPIRFTDEEAGGAYPAKRIRESPDFMSQNISNLPLFQDDVSCSSSQRDTNSNTASTAIASREDDDEVTSVRSYRPLKLQRTNQAFGFHGIQESGEAEPRAVTVVNNLVRLERSMIAGEDHISATILNFCKLSSDS
ncbi:hypothetical protein RJ639_028190 [Escallonia herrerae]|uniref:B box-type domain-containing protein n=1 Tax=Escallonia herrerae TaxID=1293975 RepID=A0AA89BFE4_9ASTE|nr:hypothetical protein RJ639_028190 [Escallonia herrerae]